MRSRGLTKIEASTVFSEKKDEELAVFAEALKEKNKQIMQVQA